MSGLVNSQPHQDLPIITKHTIMANMTIHRIRLSNMQKIVNVLALSSAVVSLAVVGGGAYVFINKDAIVDNVKSQVQDAVLGGLGGGVPSLGGDALPTGASDLSPQTNPDAAPQAAAPEVPTASVF